MGHRQVRVLPGVIPPRSGSVGRSKSVSLLIQLYAPPVQITRWPLSLGTI